MSENLAAWFLYVLSVLGCCLVWWRMFYGMQLRRGAWISSVVLACTLLAPSQVIQDTGYWAPAFMGALLELVTSTPQGLQPHLISMLIGFLMGCLLVLLLLRRQARQRVLTKETNNSQAEKK